MCTVTIEDNPANLFQEKFREIAYVHNNNNVGINEFREICD